MPRGISGPPLLGPRRRIIVLLLVPIVIALACLMNWAIQEPWLLWPFCFLVTACTLLMAGCMVWLLGNFLSWVFAGDPFAWWNRFSAWCNRWNSPEQPRSEGKT